MRHLVMSKPQCLLYSAAMALELEVEDITDILGHDGMTVINDEPEPFCYQGIHMQEIQTIAYRLGHVFAPIEVIPVSAHRGTNSPHYNICGMDYAVRFLAMINGQRGILFGQSSRGIEHAVAFEDETIYDPIGKKYGLGQFRTREAWILR
jgi:hypothetical protein